MKVTRFRAVALGICAAAAISMACAAQDSPAPDGQIASAGPLLNGEQLDQLVAPVALYPDPLLADALTAATYPLEVVEADRWIGDPGNDALRGDALTAALGAEDWDPSVKSLVPFPDVLQALDSHLDWMEMLGEAFLSQPDDVMNAVQRMRQRAQSVGNLNSPSDETVSSEDGGITISPPASNMVYVPQYDPWCAFGAWPYPVSPPYYFAPWPGDCLQADVMVSFDPGIAWPFAFWDWGYFDWRQHKLRIRHDRFVRFHSAREPKDDVWTYDPAHRSGVPYRDPRNVRRFEPQANDRHLFRGYEGGGVAPPAPSGSRGGVIESPRPARVMAPAFENFDSGPNVRMQSQRGFMSRQGSSSGFGRGFGGSAPRGGASPGRGH